MREHGKRKSRRGVREVRSCLLFLTVAAAVFSRPFPAGADVSKDGRASIGAVSLNVSSAIDVGEDSSDVEVTTGSSQYSVANVDVINEPGGEWDHKDKPKLEVTLEAERNYYFKSGFNKKNISVSGSEGKVTSVKRKSEEELEVVITLKALKATEDDYELDIDEAEWNQWNGTASWSDSEDAKHYELRLYRDGNHVTSVSPVKESSYDFSRYLNTAGTYVFKVRGVYSSKWEGEWQESDDFDVSSGKAAELSAAAESGQSGPGAGTWKNNALGWWYCYPDQSYVTNDWRQIDGKWYFFDENGYRKTGWTAWNGKWYFMNENGEMLANAVTPDGKYVGEDGALR